MNILFLLKNYNIGGIEVVTSILAETFIRHSHNVTIVSFISPSELMLSRTNKHIKIYELDGYKSSTENVKRLRDIFIKENINIVINQWGLPYIPINVIKKAKEQLNIKVISIYHNSPDTNARIKSVEIELEKNSNPINRLVLLAKKRVYSYITKKSMRYVYKNSDVYQVLSESFKDKFKSFTGIKNPQKLITQTNPITIETGNYSFDVTQKKKEIIYVGRIDYNQKRVIRILDIWNLIQANNKEWQLTIVGDGPEKKNLEEYVKKINLQNVHFEGFKRPKEYYERARIIILTSEYEGFPLVLAEAMAFGVVPIVYGSYSAAYDIINNNNGSIIEYNNQQFPKDIFASQMQKIMNNDQLYLNMAEQAINESKKYSIDNIYLSWEKIINQ